MTEGELDEMLSEVGGSCSFDNMIKMFQTKMAGGTFLAYEAVEAIKVGSVVVNKHAYF